MKESNVRTFWKRGRGKTVLLFSLLALALWMLSGCYMEPDTTTTGNDLTIGQNTQGFQSVITNTPDATATPAPSSAPANTNAGGSQVNWDDWDFGNDTATNPPSNVIPVGGSTSPATNPPSNATGSASATPTPTPAGTSSGTTLKSGSQGSEVRQLQTRLKELGYYTGSVDGSYGQGTVNAVKAFQAANKLTADGIAGKTTQDTLYSYYAVAKKDATITVPPSNATPKPSTSGGSSGGSTGSSTGGGTTSSQYTNGKTDIYLRLGSTGSQVKILQNRLIVLGYISGTADGTFGETTEAAVAAFQKRNGLDNDGVAGPSTLTKLYSSSAKKAASVASNLGSLSVGMTGGGVKAMQQKLKDLGYYTGKVDGDFGAGTQAAVIAFQAASGLKQDGIAGTETLNAIYGGGSSGGGGSASSFTASSTGYSTIREGAQGSSNVKAIQTALKNLCYYSSTIDGNYGSGTVSAVKNYQQAVGLNADGVCGPTTQRYLFGNTSSESASYSSLKSGATGSAVKNLQYTLYELRYYDGEINGTYDALTESAVREFQSVNGLTVDGAAGKQTQRLLYSANAKNALYGGGSSGSGGSAAGSASKYSTLSLGDSNETVMMMQDSLVSLNYLGSGTYSTAVFDDATANALQLFVAKNSGKLSSSAPTSGKKATSEVLELLLDGSPVSN